MTFVVCPLSQVAAMCAARQPSHVLTLLSPGSEIPAATGAQHLTLSFNDITEPTIGLVAADEELMRRLLDFSESWDGAAPMLIHCWAGISRSPAAAFASACQRHPDLAEREIAAGLRQAAPAATPNPLLVRLADRLLARHGRMIDAIEEIGRGIDAFEGTPFDLAF